MKKIMFFASAALITCALAFSVSAESPLTITNAAISDSATEGVSTVTFECSSAVDTEQLSMILTSEELTEDIAFDKIVHIDQVEVSENGTYSFSVLNSRIAANATELYLNIGGMGIDEPAGCTIKLLSVVPGDCDDNGAVNADDIVLLRKYIAGLTTSINLENADVDKASTAVNADDLVKLRKAVAGLITLD